jgi:hypothetical protein
LNRSRPQSLFFIFLLLLAASLALTSCGDDDSIGNADYTRLANPYGLYAPGTFEQTTGDNVQAILSKLGYEELAEFQDFTLEVIRELGISWVRIDFLYSGGEFIEYPDYFQGLDEINVDVVGTIRPVSALAPGEGVQFSNTTRKLIRENPGITIWQMDNEPGLGKYDPEEYVDVFLVMRSIVREECPSCRIALAGAAVPYEGGTADQDYFTQVFRLIKQYTGEVRPFDIIDLHIYGRAGNYRTIPSLLEDYRQLLGEHGFSEDISIWITECATYTGIPSKPAGYPNQTEEQQAAELLKRFAIAAAEGSERYAWNRYYENYQYKDEGNGFFDNTGLVFNGLGPEADLGIEAGTRKKAFLAYKTLIAETSGFTAVEELTPGQYRYTFDDDRAPVYLLWEEDGSPVTVELDGKVLLTDFEGNQYSSDSISLTEMPIFARKG